MSSQYSKVVLVSGIFNVLHAGHIRLFQFAKGLGDKLVVYVSSDRIAGEVAFIDQDSRIECIKTNRFVDEVHLLDEKIGDLISRIQPDFVVKGREHESSFNEEEEALRGYGGILVFSPGAGILDRYHHDITASRTVQPRSFIARHEIDNGRMLDLVARFRSLKVMVVGDLIVDEYISCLPVGMSREEPSLVVSPFESERYLGGAGIVAAHASGLGATSFLHTVVGKDEPAEFAHKKLFEYAVDPILKSDKTRPTTVKKRYRCDGRSLLRVNIYHQDAIEERISSEFVDEITAKLNAIDILIFSDFSYGCLPFNVVRKIVSAAKKANVFIAADSQSSSQVGDVTKFSGVSLLTPTEFEARLAFRNQEDGVVRLVAELKERLDVKSVILKLGSEGAFVQEDVAGAESVYSDQIPALNSSPIDGAGAGGSMLVVSALCLALGSSIWEAAYLGSLAAAIQVSRCGNTPLSPSDLTRELSI